MISRSKTNISEEQIDNVISENSVLRSKLQSKIEALSIMTKQLDKYQAERDHFKLLVEQLQTRYPCIQKNEIDPNTFFSDVEVTDKYSSAQLLASTRDQNRHLLIQIETLKHKLEEAEEDIHALKRSSSSRLSDRGPMMVTQQALNFEREELVRQLEESNKKIEQMQSDLKSMLDEKEDLINERDAYKCKLHRLNHELMVALSKNKTTADKTKPGLLLDIDALVMENRYLQERLSQAISEKDLAAHALSKYKSILETKQQKGILRLGTNNTNSVVSHKQVKQLLESGTVEELPVTAATISDLRALSSGLLDSLNDKALALSHQKKANKILAARIADLEKKLESGSDSEEKVSVFPSKVLLESYCSSDVDHYKIDVTTSPIRLIPEEQNGEANDEEQDDKAEELDCGSANNENDLPLELQKLVQEALDDLYAEEK